ncbi:MAG: DUF3488 domain-containing protein [Desulfobacula sp.]|nr:DUF3488 domain-containing protein [Desulfobacula sp.]
MKAESAHVLPVIGALVVAIAPHTPGLPLWINAWCLVMWGYVLVQLKTGWPLPGNMVRYALAFASIAGLLLTYRFRIGADTFIGLLALMAAIKPFEMATHRHQMITVLLTYFIIITSLFRSESMFIVFYMFFSVFVTTIALVRVNAPQDPFRQSLNMAARIMAQAIPLMVLLFLLFPRLPGSLFGVEDKTLGRSGFSDRLSPGSVSRLTMDQTPAFRAEFNGPLPLAEQLYWRGIVFQAFDGKTWTTRASALPAPPAPPPTRLGENHTYTIVLEPHNAHWLMALDRPVKGPPWADLTQDGVLKSRLPVKQKIRYTATSLAGETSGETKVAENTLPEEMAAAIISPSKNQNPKTRALAMELARMTDTPTEKSRILLAYFKENSFVYTLTPPTAERHPIDSFLLDQKKGYCEHYASAFGFMMNVLGVPARIVGGYLGGEHNPYSRYLTIRNSYAHAWVEFFDPDRGWVRVDPTMAVAPDRIRTNPDGSSAVPESAAGTLSFARKIKFALEAANLRWEAWFTGYSYFEQKAFLQKLGLEKWKGVTGTLLVLLLVTLGALAVFSGIIFWLLRPKKNKPDPVGQAYFEFCFRLDKLGLARPPHQGPWDFARACGEKRVDLQTEIMAITALYVQLRFQKNCPHTALADFKTRIHLFHPKPDPRKEHPIETTLP